MDTHSTIAATAPGAAPTRDIYVVAAHPNWQESRVNRQLLDAAKADSRTLVCDVFASYADYHIDIFAEQANLAKAHLIVLLHPIHWYAMPALLKLWVDEVLAFGWAYGGGKALHGKDLWLVATTGGPEAAYHPQGYNRYFFDAFLPPYEQTAHLCGMRFLPPLVLHGAHSVPESEVQTHVATFSQRLATYPQWPELADLAVCNAPSVPATDRPQD